MINRITCNLLTIAFLLACAAPAALAQSPKRLLERMPGQPKQPRGASVAATRLELARVDAQALTADRIELTLFDDVRVTARRLSRSHARAGSTVWQGKLEAPDRGEVTLALVDGALAGSVTAGGRTFEIGFSADGLHEVREVDHSLFPTEDPPVDGLDLVSASGAATSTTTTSGSGTGGGQIDVMVVWTPAARNAAGGTAAAIQSLVDLAVANANAAYAYSNISTSLRLVYSGEVSYTENPSSLSTDLSRLSGTSDGYVDQVHSLRNQYGADIVTLVGSGYASAGYCGMGYLMSSVSTSFAGNAFNVVDQACAGGYLSYAHEVGHNQGLHHDPANAGSSPSYPYAYGYQDPAGYFRTVMSYGGAPRVQQFSNPTVYYGGRPTGTSSQNNAQALNNTAGTVANFRTSAGGTTCTYSLTPTVMVFSETGGTGTVDVTTAAGCSWTTVNGTDWISVGPGGSGSGSVTVAVAPQTGGQRSATITVAGIAVSITEAGLTTPPACTYGVTPTSLSFGASGGSSSLNVTTPAGCSWTTTGGSGWVSATGGGTDSGGVTVTASANTGSARTASLTVAGQIVTVSQEAAPASSSCTYVLSSTALSVPSTGGVVQVQVTTTADCGWTARSNTGWMKASGGGTGAGPASFQVNASNSGGSRTATATVADQTVTVIQLAGPKRR